MEINNGNNVDQENPLFHEHHYLLTFDREFNRSPALIDRPDDARAAYFLRKENNGKFDPPDFIPESEKSWVKSFRLWMLQEVVFTSVDEFGLQRYRTAYMGVVYFERFLSLKWERMKGADMAIKIMGAMCVLIAAKGEEGCLPPHLPLVDRQTAAVFEMMERVIKHVLQWKLWLMTPLTLTNFMMRKFEALPGWNGGNVASRTAAFVFAAMKVNGTLEYRSSVVAAAATLAAMDRNLTRAAIEERISRSRVSDFGFTATAEEVHRCYSLINELDPYQELVYRPPLIDAIHGDQENPLLQEHNYLHTFDQQFNHSPDLINPQENDPLVASLLTKENNGQFDPPRAIPQREFFWVKRFRLWMLQELVLTSVDNLGCQRYRTAYLAVAYFERFISLEWRRLKGRDSLIRLIGWTCLLIASKEEEGCLPPHWPVVNVWAVYLVETMEAVLRRRLQLKLITPLNFANFFMRKFETFPAGYGGNVASRTAAFVFTAMKVIGTLEYRPSVVAAAATLAAMDRNMTRAAIHERMSKSRVSEFWFTATAEEVHRCYSLINELDPYRELVIPMWDPQTRAPGR